MLEARIEAQQTQKLSQNLQLAFHLLSMDLDDIHAEMQKAVAENPALEYVPAKKTISEYASTFYGRTGKGSDTYQDAEKWVAAKQTVMDDLEMQLRVAELEPDVRRVAEDMLRTLNHRGYFPHTLKEYAAETGIPLELARRALHAVQALEPAGIGARNVGECLELQLRARPDTDPLCIELTRLYLVEIFGGKIRKVAKETGASQAHIQRCVDVIRSLSPSPCDLDVEETRYIFPEFSVEKRSDDQLVIQFNNDYYPNVKRDENFTAMAETLNEEGKAYARQMISSANQLIHAIEMRQRTMSKIAEIIVDKQRAFFLGKYNLLPLRVSDVANEVGVHDTTIYRALQSKYLYCSRGTFPLSYFFQKEVADGASADHVKQMIREICAENGKLTDQKITDLLQERGIALSRRTVAKYRASMDIESSFRRDK